jgi:DMSO/TMAO reductase YedYZ molybdopterin-dependent catalytic subunit/thiosulfate reductase cytochrome b subunit
LVIESDFPFWLRYAHFLNLIFITLLIRSGIEILSALPKLYWNDRAKPGTEWIRFTKKKIPKDRLWTSLEEEESFSSWIALPGHKNLGLGRHWHFFSVIFWLANGVVYVIMLFASGEWARLVPTSPSILSDALHTAMMYASLQSPPLGDPYNALQQLTYFGVVFLLGPFMIATGAAMSPALGARFPHYTRIFGGRQVARSLHFLGLIAFVLFIITHVLMVVSERFSENMGNIVLGNGAGVSLLTAIGLFALYVVSVVAVHIWVTAISLRYPRRIQNTLGAIVEPAKRILFRNLTSRQHFSESDLSEFFRVNGLPPDTPEYGEFLQNNFASWKLEVQGMVEKPMWLSLQDLHELVTQSQITEHSCIQGWTAIAKWSGVPLIEILVRCEPKPQARYVVFHSYQYDDKGYEYYEVLDIELAKHPQTILAYEMNGKPLPVPHGAPLRLRVETQLGYKMVKWLRSIELVPNYRSIGRGQGGYREDEMYYGFGAGI